MRPVKGGRSVANGGRYGSRIFEQIFWHANEENKTVAHVPVLLEAHNKESTEVKHSKMYQITKQPKQCSKMYPTFAFESTYNTKALHVLRKQPVKRSKP